MITRTITLAVVLLLQSPSLFAQINPCDNLVNEVYRDARIIKPDKVNNPPLQYNKINTQLLDVSYVDDSLSGRQCSAANDCVDGSGGLKYEVYYPDIKYSDSKRLPAIIFFHAGGFSDCSGYDHEDGITIYCVEFAKRGFVAFNVEYRRGRRKDTNAHYISASQELALYRAFQDTRGALRTIVAREISHAAPYRIDVDNIFLGGQSSGGDIALDVGYCTPKMMKEIFPGITTYLGQIAADNYAGNATPDTYTIRGVLSMWGGFAIPLNYASSPADFLSQNPNPPALIAFHGNADDVVKINSKNIFFSPASSVYGQESSCIKRGTYIPDNGPDSADQVLLGSQALYDNLKTVLRVHSELYIDCDMDHGLDEETSDFGLAGGDASAVSDSEVQVYIVQRAATFFQYIMNTNRPHLKHTRFVECVNYRYGCNSDSDNTCNKNAICAAAALNDSNVSSENSTVKNNANPLCRISQVNRMVYINFYKAGKAKISLFNMDGAAVKTIPAINTSAVLDASGLPAGIYIVHVIRGTEIQRTKIILQ